jgi:hypothetical protein
VPPKLDAVFFATKAGHEPVRDWLLALSKGERKTIGTDIAYVQWSPMGDPLEAGRPDRPGALRGVRG